MKTFNVSSLYEIESEYERKNFQESLCFEDIWDRIGYVNSFPSKFVFPAAGQECETKSRGKLNEKVYLDKIIVIPRGFK